MLVLSLLDHSSTKIGSDPHRLFRQAADLAEPETAELLTEYVSRPHRMKSIEAMGYEETLDKGRFIYRRTW